MSETEQLYLPLQTESSHTDNGFYDSLNFIRENANSQYGVGKVFERLIKSYLLEDPFYKRRFSDVYLWSEWAEIRPEFDAHDLGIDLVAAEQDGGFCAIQCKCYAENKRITKKDIDSFISYSNRHPFTSRILLTRIGSWKTNHGLRYW